jgi:16S rRNA (cytidine1402-2'-O)-methyltransferase
MKVLSDMIDILGERRAALAKELTKLHEEVLRGTIPEIIQALETRMIAGEYVIIVEGFHQERWTIEEALSEVNSLMKKGLGRKEAVKTVSEGYGISKKELYDKSLSLNTT